MALMHPRKRSRQVSLLLMVPAATSLLLAGCGEQNVPAVVYRDAAECTQQNPQAADQCRQDFEQAKANHPNVAPKYLSREECEADFGRERCEVAPTQHSSGSFFMPMMLGYMAGRMTSPGPAGFTSATAPRRDDDQSGTGGVRGASGFTPQPLYKSRDDANTFRTADNEPVSRRSGAVDVRPETARAAPAGRVARSGGFGATASRMTGATGG